MNVDTMLKPITNMFVLVVLLLSTAAFAQNTSWQDLPLTDARTGETFTLGGLGGYVYAEPMATWCSNCRQQLGNVRDAAAQLGGDEVTFVALSVETSLKSRRPGPLRRRAGF